MNSFNFIFIKTIRLCTILLLIVSCEDQKREIEKITLSSDYLLNSEITDKLEKSTEDWKTQVAADDYAAKGDYKNALEQWDQAMGGAESSYTAAQADSINSLYTKVAADDYISAQSKNHQIVIVNEAHHNSSHRVFTRTLLQNLYDNGYRHFGLEALGNGVFIDSTLNDRKYPVQKTGYYIKDPQFGNLVRTALEIGYRLFPYETTNRDFNGKPRETDQAKNIQKEMVQYPGEKFLIHCGYDHAFEGTHGSWEKAMAGRLHELTDINPLTINQTMYSEKANNAYNHPLLKALDIKEPTVLLDKNNHPFQVKRNEAYTDIAVFHPNTSYVDNRPEWLFKNSNKKVSIDLKEVQIAFPVMILVYKKGEDISTAVPVDITEVNNNTTKATLGLPTGDYVMIVTNGKESVKFNEVVR